MNITQLIDRLSALKAAHGGTIEVTYAMGRSTDTKGSIVSSPIHMTAYATGDADGVEQITLFGLDAIQVPFPLEEAEAEVATTEDLIQELEGRGYTVLTSSPPPKSQAQSVESIIDREARLERTVQDLKDGVFGSGWLGSRVIYTNDTGRHLAHIIGERPRHWNLRFVDDVVPKWVRKDRVELADSKGN